MVRADGDPEPGKGPMHIRLSVVKNRGSASTKFLSKLEQMDRDGDGQIDAEELEVCWQNHRTL
jgi:hypothetical protein